MWDDLWVNGRLATMTAGGAAYGAIEDGAIAAAEGRIAWVGPRRDLPGAPEKLARHVHDLARHLAHARPDRLPYPSRLCRRPGARVRAPAAGREL